jgi:hypothetical protein
VGGRSVTTDIGTILNDPEAAKDVEDVLSTLAMQTDQKASSRLKQLDAYFFRLARRTPSEAVQPSDIHHATPTGKSCAPTERYENRPL